MFYASENGSQKKKKRVLGFKFLGFLRDGFGVKEKKKAGTGRIMSDCHGYPLVTYILALQCTLCKSIIFQTQTK
jgi:hypothetical protein